MVIQEDRRGFFRILGRTLAIFMGLQRLVKEGSAYGGMRSKATGKVVVTRNPALVDPSGGVNHGLAYELITRGLSILTRTSGAPECWKALFHPGDRVGIKVNALSGQHLSSHPGLIRALVKGIKEAGVKDKDILIWDRTTRELRRAGFAINKGSKGVRCFGTDQVGYEIKPEIQGSIGSCFSRILTRFCNTLVNVPVLKDHDLAGASLSLKNLYGAIHNPNKYHDNGCSPYVADLNSHPFIRNKTRLIICDGLLAQCHGGPAFSPAWAWEYRGFLIGLDPVAVDAIGLKILEERRRKVGLKSFTQEGRSPKYIFEAEKKGLGVADLKKIGVINLS